MAEGCSALLAGLRLDAAVAYTSIWEEGCSFDMSSSGWVGATVCCLGRSISLTQPGANSSREKTLNTSQPPHRTAGSAQKPLELPSPSLFLVSAQRLQTTTPGDGGCQRCGLNKQYPCTKSICHPLCNTSDHNFLTSSLTNFESNL